MAEREIGVGIVGFGLGGRVFHAPFVEAGERAALAASCNARANEAARPIPAAADRPLARRLAGEQGDRSGRRHPRRTRRIRAGQAALEAGKHVVIDKPFAATSEQRLALGQIAKSKGLLAVRFTTAVGTAIS